MSCHVFLGPSLGLEEAREIAPLATFHPPAAAGDVLRVARTGRPQLIAVLDGLFEQVPAVWHKEILFALEKGIRVVGGVSMGALRARELQAFGMEGRGEVFRLFETDELEDDDEVAITHGPRSHGYPSFSVAMVTIRHAFGAARVAGLLTSGEQCALVAAYKGRFYAERRWEDLPELLADLGVVPERVPEIVRFVRSPDLDLKRQDAIGILAWIQEQIDGDRLGVRPGGASQRPRFALEPTTFWQRLVESQPLEVASAQSSGSPGAGVDPVQLASHAKLNQETPGELSRRLLLLALVRAEARSRGIVATESEIRDEIRLFRAERRLLDGETTRAWLESQALTQRDVVRLAELEVLVRRLVGLHRRSLDALLPLELKRTGAFREQCEQVLEKRRFLASRGIENPSLEATGVCEAELWSWYQETHRPILSPPEDHARRLGFEVLRDFTNEVLTEYLQEQSRPTRKVS